MRKLFFIVIGIVFLLVPLKVEAGGGFLVPMAGSLDSADEPVQKTVRNTAGEALSDGDVVVWRKADFSAAEFSSYGSSVTYGVDVTTPTTQAETVAGVLTEDIADGKYGKMAVWGYCDKINVGYAPTAIGDILVATSTINGTSTADHASSISAVVNLGDEGGFAEVWEVGTGSTTVKGWLFGR